MITRVYIFASMRKRNETLVSVKKKKKKKRTTIS